MRLEAGTPLRFLGYGNVGLAEPSRGYLTCGEWPLARVVREYAGQTLSGAKVFQAGLEFGYSADGVHKRPLPGPWWKRLLPPPIPCTGDSGGPVFAKLGGGFFLVGLVSTGEDFCQQDVRSTAADLRALRTWVDNTPMDPNPDVW